MNTDVSSVMYCCLCRIMSKVQQRLDEEAREKEAAEREPKHWREVVEDIWEEYLPHFRGAVYTGDGDFLFDAAEGRYLFQRGNLSEGEDDLMEGGDEEEEEEGEREDEDEFVEIPEENEGKMTFGDTNIPSTSLYMIIWWLCGAFI